ncbi:GPO family capsid scaffolding protein [Acinetobacter baumannii]|uniref:GPO family capsid scaffolding protein n=1 Tax=Acinetobacter baumannii TaxID=470 RepID=UPI0018A8C039|nr:GPO family capsid scaffolding protein [Acinetobacter baumannii]EKT8316680.1 GPO family capsid scaffolding protein [Acinetobacter baumannii]EKU4658168.1 GPO family capsid scaffolding protein [Acinetobacter baumannii]EKV5598983.1 GPO family capsid scaffolding protein [Acinetobacter baumannii]EKV5699862.1 GPO family capsid scaffolding protein [Acinetobacter baumannii]EKV6803111.1 GPO family capsid scaffolding protein [Acinetobacter baumannii]
MSSKEQKPKKFKSKWFRIATAGDTTDGREIQENWIQEIVETYNPQTYGARINVEHIRSVFPDSSFGAYGDVVAVKAEKVEVNGEKKLTLFAQIEPNENLIELNKRKQKIYTSIEVNPNFANTGKAYLVGLAVTDSPASLGTDMLQFAANAEVNPLESKKQHKDNLFTAAIEADLDFEEVAEPKVFGAGLVESVRKLFKKQEQRDQATTESFSNQEQAILEIAQQAADQGAEVTELQNSYKELQQKHEQLANDFSELKEKLDGTPDQPSRPKASRSSFSELDEDVDC